MDTDTFSQNPNMVILEDPQIKGGVDAHGIETGTATVAQTYFNMFKVFIGIGILATPHAI